jgi:subtilase family serine protease
MIRKGWSLWLSAVTLALVFNFTLASSGQTTVQGRRTRPLITERIDDARRVMLGGNTRPEARSGNDRGRVGDDFSMEHMLLQLRRPAEKEAALKQFIDELHKPNSPNYHRWLTAQQFGEQYGPAKEDLDAVTNWLQIHGLNVNVIYASGMVIDFSGTAGMVRQAFGTEIHRLDVKGKSHVANMSDPRIPAALAPAVVGVASLHDFKPHAMHRLRAQYTFNSFGSPYQAVVPADLATIYDLNPLFNAGVTGTGQTIVVVEDTNFKGGDWTTFRKKFGLSKYTDAKLTQVHPPSKGTNNCHNPGLNGDDIEAALDAEWASAAAPDANIELASCANTNTTFGGLIAIQNLLNASATPPAIISMSYGECETFNGEAANAAFNSAFQQAVAEGVSVFVSAGDEGAASCDPQSWMATHGVGVTGWGETPYNVAVGGTDFGDTFAGTNSTYWSATNTSTFGSALSYIPEIPWNDSCASVLIATYVTASGITYGGGGFCNSGAGEQFLGTIAGSGGPSGCATGSPTISGVVSGTCQGYGKPSWQAGVLGVPKDGVRDVPDVSLFAANGVWGHYYVFCDSDIANGGSPCGSAPYNWSGAGGTSFSSPILAGIQALVNQKTGARQGNPNPVYYALAAAEYGKTGSTACNSKLGSGVASTCVFRDVTQGDIDVNCIGNASCFRPGGINGVLSTSSSSNSPAYGTTKGWDFATGLGTVDATNLVNQWSTVAP